MKCHYEILELPRDADSDDIKKAYRKLAIKWHPDKNLENIEDATEQFKLVQQAFEVLSDPHERAWYDDHREAILKGKVGSEYDDESLDVYQYFTPSCYRGFSDDEKGFYSVYREVFNKIAAEDSEYQTEQDSDFEVPSFGKSDSNFEEVKSFYNYWQSYCTKKSYSWLDYDTRDAPNRRFSRAVEKENKKIRDKARKARNEEIRELVKFVRKRDKRIQAYAQYLQELSIEKAKKSEEKRREKIKARTSELAAHKESDWAKFSNFEDELKSIEANLASQFGDDVSPENSDFDEEITDRNLYCVACNKLFKTSKAFENHASSKKHKENVQKLKQEMQDSDNELNFEIDDSEDENTSDDDCNEDDAGGDIVEGEEEHDSDGNILVGGMEGVSEEPLLCKVCGVWFKTEKGIKNHKLSEDHVKNVQLRKEIVKNIESEETEDDTDVKSASSGPVSENEYLENFCNGNSNWKEQISKVLTAFDIIEKSESESLGNDVNKICGQIDDIIKNNEKLEGDDVYKTKVKSRKKSSKGTEEGSSHNSEFSHGSSKKQKRKQKNKCLLISKTEETTNKNIAEVLDRKRENISEVPHNSCDSVILDDGNSTTRVNLGIDNQDTEPKKSVILNKNNKKKQDKNVTVSNSCDLDTSCAMCKSTFPSKNKLFQHLKKTGHSMYLPDKKSKSLDIDEDCGKKVNETK